MNVICFAFFFFIRIFLFFICNSDMKYRRLPLEILPSQITRNDRNQNYSSRQSREHLNQITKNPQHRLFIASKPHTTIFIIGITKRKKNGLLFWSISCATHCVSVRTSIINNIMLAEKEKPIVVPDKYFAHFGAHSHTRTHTHSLPLAPFKIKATEF